MFVEAFFGVNTAKLVLIVLRS